ncbi:DUF1931 family protein [Streptomyces odontomachi]|uniref:DUF1931 family protein n=1 Tax=Streptomyces odontomachi TaxID=2944940 RepID=UPI00210B0F3A|nr:DUF1931 family protein [Streptomyces sp. ODS25]
MDASPEVIAMPVMGVHRFERFFREAAGLTVDKNDVKAYNDFVNDKIYDFFLIGATRAKANGRDLIEPQDLPVTKGLQECIRDFHKIDQDIELRPLLEELTARPALELSASEETNARLPDLAGGLSVALARALRTVDPERRHPLTPQWEHVFDLFHLLL